MICAGVDVGSRTIKAVLYDAERRAVVGSAVGDQGIDQRTLAEKLLAGLAAEHGIGRDEILYTVATGYGRGMLDFADRRITEISCHAAGVKFYMPKTAMIVDIGGQDSKIIHLDDEGNVEDFCMNDRCAAGTGRFLELVAVRTEVAIEELGQLAARSKRPAAISSMCVVFAETEIVGLMALGVSVNDIIAGVQASIADRIAAMNGQYSGGVIAFTGGVAMVPGMKDVLEKAIGAAMQICPSPQTTGALGAALLGAKYVQSDMKKG